MAKNNANTYNADAITILEGLEAVRRRPGMYIGSVSTKGLNHLIYEIVDNAVDEHLAGYCTDISITLNEDGSVTVKFKASGEYEIMWHLFRWGCDVKILAPTSLKKKYIELLEMTMEHQREK